MNRDFWSGRRVLVTGHTGFKGAWLSFWLHELGAKVSGIALAPQPGPNLSVLLGLDGVIRSHLLDINDRVGLERALQEDAPEVIFHFAAQSLVRRSYREPTETFAANVLGVVNLLHVVSQSPSVRAVIIATSDKCYENREWIWGYRENDRMGGRDPYSASKGCAELAAASMRQSFFAPCAPGGHAARIATVRAGNVIGGGDWSEDRLIPDIVRGCLGPEGVVDIRAPGSVRPWQHVLEPLSGYVSLAEKLASGAEGFDEGWNFGPVRADERPVLDVAKALVAALGKGRIELPAQPAELHEANLLRLDSSKAHGRLGWRPVLDFARTIEMTAGWYGAWANGSQAEDLCRAQIQDYMARGDQADD